MRNKKLQQAKDKQGAQIKIFVMNFMIRGLVGLAADPTIVDVLLDAPVQIFSVHFYLCAAGYSVGILLQAAALVSPRRREGFFTCPG